MQKKEHHECPIIVIPILDTNSALQSCLRHVAGLALIQRVALMAQQAACKQPVLVVSQEQDAVLSNTLAGTDAQCIRMHELENQHEQSPVLLLAPDCLPDASFFLSLGEKQVAPDEALLWDDDLAILIGAGCVPVILDSIAQAHDFAQLIAIMRNDSNISAVKQLHASAGLSIRHSDDCRRAENTLLSGLVKATEGWMALHINRKISLAVTRRLMHTCVTPNHMTGVSMLLGLIGAACFLSPAHSLQVLGALFFLSHSILDGCDGELARLKFMESRLGGTLDFWSDNIVHVSVFAAMGMGWAARYPDSFWPLVCAILAVVSTTASASLVYFHTMHAVKKTGPLYTSVSTAEGQSAVVKIADMLSRRDFIYLVLLLALFDHTHWFLIMTAVGAPTYALLLIGIMIYEKESV